MSTGHLACNSPFAHLTWASYLIGRPMLDVIGGVALALALWHSLCLAFKLSFPEVAISWRWLQKNGCCLGQAVIPLNLFLCKKSHTRNQPDIAVRSLFDSQQLRNA